MIFLKNRSFGRVKQVVFILMLCKHPLLALTSGLVFSMGFVGCAGSKNKDVSKMPAVAPPPAAYPDNPASYSDPSGNRSTAVAANGYAPANLAPNASSDVANAETFQLRPGEQVITHSIERGDTLSGIAKHYNSSQSRIMAANRMTNTKIIAGETLLVPTSAPPTGLAMNGAGAGATSAPADAGASDYNSPGSSVPYSRAGSLYSSPGLKAPSSPYSPRPATAPSSPYSAPAPVSPSNSYGSGNSESSTTGSSYPSPTNNPSEPSATSSPRVQSAPAPPQSRGAFPTPDLSRGSGQVQFSN